MLPKYSSEQVMASRAKAYCMQFEAHGTPPQPRAFLRFRRRFEVALLLDEEVEDVGSMIKMIIVGCLEIDLRDQGEDV